MIKRLAQCIRQYKWAAILSPVCMIGEVTMEVLIPLVITAVCLLLMFVSRRILTPWLVSMFSLALPVIILLLNIFPA